MSQNIIVRHDNRYLMVCPRCEEEQDILAFVPLKLFNEEKYRCVPAYKCRLCKAVFAPIPDPLDITPKD